MRDKEDNPLFFTTQVNFDKPIHRASFVNEINDILIKASEKLGKHIRINSFRAYLITSYLKETPYPLLNW